MVTATGRCRMSGCILSFIRPIPNRIGVRIIFGMNLSRIINHNLVFYTALRQFRQYYNRHQENQAVDDSTPVEEELN